MTVAGLEIPLTSDALFQSLLRQWRPVLSPDRIGTLDGNGDALVGVASTSHLAPFIGSVLSLAAVSLDQVPLAGRLSSIARTVEIVP